MYSALAAASSGRKFGMERGASQERRPQKGRATNSIFAVRVALGGFAGRGQVAGDDLAGRL